MISKCSTILCSDYLPVIINSKIFNFHYVLLSHTSFWNTLIQPLSRCRHHLIKISSIKILYNAYLKMTQFFMTQLYANI